MKQRSVVEIEVRYAETDQMGIVHHANYLVWFELARTRFCAEIGAPYPKIEELGYFMIISQAQQDYRLAACYGDTVKVDCWLDRVARRTLQFGYQVTRGDQILSNGYTKHIWVERDSRRPCSILESLHQTFLKCADQITLKSSEIDLQEKMLCP